MDSLMSRQLYVATAIMLGCATVASTMPSARPVPSAATAAPVQALEFREAVGQITVSSLPLPQAAPPMTTMPADIAAMATTYLLSRRGQPGPKISFPANAATAHAIKRIASRSVSSIPNRCAGTMREAMGWGLGDAHKWMKLPQKGFAQRPPGTPAKAGDILVWPFTYGSRGSQHIGIAVDTDNGVRLLSNLSGSICLKRVTPGYRAFYKTG